VSVRLFHGDCRAVLPTLPEASVQCVVTSPPYWGLRDYGVEGQLGLEPTPEAYVEAMVGVFREVRRVLRDDGTLWLNMGDSYAGGKTGNTNGGAASGLMRDGRPEQGRRASSQRLQDHMAAQRFTKAPPPDCKPKDLVGVPWRLAFALQADGWYLRADIIWTKPNPMPESVTDRPTKAHEYIFLLSKAARYFYDADAVREPAEYGRREWSSVRGNLASVGINGVRGHATVGGGDPSTGRNLRSVWTIPSAPFPDAHFATFPPALASRCILAGCPAGGTVLDPFAGSGTVGEVAERLGRHSVLVELSPAYVAMAKRRTAQLGLFTQAGACATRARASIV
jgi:DNA modification methylase